MPRLSYKQLTLRISKLQAQAAELKKRQDTKEVLARINEAIAHYGFEPNDFTFTSKAPKPKSARSAAAKYRDSATGLTWVGRGPRPHWLRDAIAAGKALSDYLVAGVTKPAETTLMTAASPEAKKTGAKRKSKPKAFKTAKRALAKASRSRPTLSSSGADADVVVMPTASKGVGKKKILGRGERAAANGTGAASAGPSSK